MQTIHSSADTKIDEYGLAPTRVEHLLVQEISHRVNNELTSIIGFAVSIAGRSKSHEVKSALTEVTDVLYRYAGVHRALQMPSHNEEIDASEYVGTLCHSLKRALLDPRGIEFVLASRSFKLRSQRCWKLGLIVSELITNSARHAFGNQVGTIMVTLDASDSLAECGVRDNGLAQSAPKIGQGLKIIDALARDLGGTITHEFAAEGATSILAFPIDNDAPFIDVKATRLGSARR